METRERIAPAGAAERLPAEIRRFLAARRLRRDAAGYARRVVPAIARAAALSGKPFVRRFAHA